MLIIGMASFSQGFTNKQKKGTSLDWYFILTLWTIAIDIYWNSFSITFYYPHSMDFHMRIVHALHNIITVKSTFFDNSHLFVLRDLRCCKNCR